MKKNIQNKIKKYTSTYLVLKGVTDINISFITDSVKLYCQRAFSENSNSKILISDESITVIIKEDNVSSAIWVINEV